MDSFVFDLMETHDYENIFFCQEKALARTLCNSLQLCPAL
jgi:hypothetical protein